MQVFLSTPGIAADTARLTLRVARPADAAAAATVPRAAGLPPPSDVASEGSADPGPCSRDKCLSWEELQLRQIPELGGRLDIKTCRLPKVSPNHELSA
jgi:hypothetical protein